MDENEKILYTSEPFDTFLPVDYEQQGDQWMDILTRTLLQKIPNATGNHISGKQASSELRYPHIELVINRTENNTAVPADTPTLKIVPLTQNDDTKALYVVLASGRPIGESDTRVWVECLSEATAKLDEENPEFEWAAALGQSNDHSSQKYSLKKRLNIEGVVIRSGGQQYIDNRIASNPPHFLSSSFAISWPVVVEGKSKGYDWTVASRQAGIDTHKVAVLLSLAWNSTWYLIQSPIPKEPGALKIPKTNPLMPSSGRTRSFSYPRKSKVIPKWVSKAWSVIDGNLDLDAATTAYYQGLMMEKDHPSFALVAFIASIEIIGKKIIGDKCSCCGKPTGDSQAFRAGIDAVVKDTRKAKELHLLYKSRSTTAHRVELHANEDVLGYLSFPSMFKQDNKSMFVFTDLLKAKAASRKLLLAVLNGTVVVGK
jgi:hypothetical protein